ncbi:POTRA domain-containing protein [Robbsia sp. KACC 23696]|uniref:ShlB/FhaC/HecB family hemolysin secretion/activation protein n=1 Tax=Robbsia sp. KACC 23696 TaxID=3149231 RepID=UPI00325B4E17
MTYRFPTCYPIYAPTLMTGMACLCAALMPGAALAQARISGNGLQSLPRVTPPPAQKVNITVDTPEPNTMEGLLSKTIVPKSIRLEGVKSIPFDEASAAFTGFVGKPTTIQQLIEAANAVTKRYQEHGFALSFAFVPAQDFANGVVRVVAVEGYVSKVTIDGKVGNAERHLRAIADHLLNQRPLRREAFERYTALLGQIPGLKVAANIAPPQSTDGATEMKLSVVRQKIGFTTGVSLNQPGIQGLFTISENGLLSLGEQLSISALAPRGRDGQTYFGVNYTQPIGSDGLTAKVDASRFSGEPRTTPGLASNVHRRTEQDRVGVTLSYPIILNNTRSLTVNGSGYAVRNDDRYSADGGAIVGLRSQSRVLQTEIVYAESQPKLSRRVSLTVGKGIDALGASREGYTNVIGATVANPVDLSFFRIGASAMQTNQWPLGFATVVSATGQYSAQALPTSEQITFGGQRYALAYQPGEAAGDKGWGTSAELNRTFTFSMKYLKTWVPYISYALARTYLNVPGTLPLDLQSLALGFRVSDSRFYSLDLSVAQPVGDKPSGSSTRSPRVNATFSYQLD